MTFGLEVISILLKDTKYKNILTVTGNQFIDKSLIESKFLVTNKNIKEYIKNI